MPPPAPGKKNVDRNDKVTTVHDRVSIASAGVLHCEKITASTGKPANKKSRGDLKKF